MTPSEQGAANEPFIVLNALLRRKPFQQATNFVQFRVV